MYLTPVRLWVMMLFFYSFQNLKALNDSRIHELDSCTVKIALINSKEKTPIAGVIRIKNENNEFLKINKLLNRGTGLDEDYGPAWDSLSSWYAVPATGGLLTLPAESLTIEALCGIRSFKKVVKVDLKGKVKEKISIPLTFFNNEDNAFTGNVHLHFKNISPALAHEYAVKVPPADDLDLVFFSFLNRPVVEQKYPSNFFTNDSLAEFKELNGVMYGYGEEYRNNFSKGGGGYGHVMFLPYSPVMRPASLGPGIMNEGYDDGTLSEGIDKAISMGSTILWCHNQMGHEDIPNWVLGKLDGQIIYDTGNEDKYEESFYRYLNSGIPVSFATGTDWFMTDMSATMVWLPEESELTIENWLKYFRNGKSYITNGPLLELDLEGSLPGDSIRLYPGRELKIKALVKSRNDFGKAEIVMNGKVVFSAKSTFKGGLYQSYINEKIKLENSAWFALRIPQTSDKYKEPLINDKYYNEYGKPLFAHTSPVYVLINDKSFLSEKDMKSLIDEMEESKLKIGERGVFSSPDELDKTLDYYNKAIKILSERIEQYNNN